MQLIATGKWSKAKKGWMMLVALRRPAGASGRRPAMGWKRPVQSHDE
jgi:hypothetical protein